MLVARNFPFKIKQRKLSALVQVNKCRVVTLRECKVDVLVVRVWRGRVEHLFGELIYEVLKPSLELRRTNVKVSHAERVGENIFSGESCLLHLVFALINMAECDLESTFVVRTEVHVAGH